MPSHVTFGTVVSVFGKVEPRELSEKIYYHIVEPDDCNSEVVDVTSK